MGQLSLHGTESDARIHAGGTESMPLGSNGNIERIAL